MRGKIFGKTGFWMVVLLSVAMMVTAWFTFPVIPDNASLGLCLPSPNLWDISQPWSAILQGALILLTAPAMMIFNKTFNFVGPSGYVYPSIFLLLTASNPWLTHFADASVILALCNLIALSILFSCYNRRNNQNAIFYLGTVIGIGAMVQYAFVPYALVYLLAAGILKVVRLRDTIAYGVGLCIPYWIVFGMGILPLDNFKIPAFEILPVYFTPTPDAAVMLMSTAAIVLTGLILMLINSVNMGGSSSKSRAFNKVINFLAVCTVIFMILDLGNMTVYLCTLFMCVGIQAANTFHWGSPRNPGWIMAAIGAVMFGIMLLTIYI